MSEEFKRTMLLFDVDGTLTAPRLKMENDMRIILQRLKDKGYTIAVVGGSDRNKQIEQLGDFINEFHYVFSENGLLSYKEGAEFHRKFLVDLIGNEQLKKFIKKCLYYLADLDIPIQRGTFIELRTGMINISPIGRNCTQSERIEFAQYDNEHCIRQKMINFLKEAFPELPFQYSIGGQISFDVFPRGWDKTYCLQFCSPEYYDIIHFFGDKTHPGGNDHEIYNHTRTLGHHVNNYKETIDYLNKFLK